MEYWIAMNLAGDYASACHEVIHAKSAAQLGRQQLLNVENHYNFAWKEIHEGREVIVHRKGATPAAKDVLGIIPGSMTAAIKSITPERLKETLQHYGVKLLGVARMKRRRPIRISGK